jgi:O-antigen/teichoic acid export membrane protein
MKMRGTHWPLTILSGGSSVLNFVLPLVMSRKLDPAVVGEFKLFFLYLGVMPVVSLGVGFLNGTYTWGAEPGRGPATVRRALALSLGFSALAGAAAATIAAKAGFAYALLFGLATPPAVSAAIYEAGLIARGNTRRAAWFALAFELLRMSLMLACASMRFPLAAILVSHVAATWLKLVVGSLAVFRSGGPAAPGETRDILRYALPVSGASAFDLLIQNADRYLLAFLLTAPDFALYTFGCLMLPPAFIFEQSVSQVLISKLSGKPPGSVSGAALYRHAVEELMLFLFPLAALLAAIAEPLIRLLFTARYASASGYLVVYAPYYALLALPHDAYARARGDSAWIFRTCVWVGIVSVATSGAGAYLGGPKGALVGFLVGQAVRRAYGTYSFGKREKLPLRTLFPFRAAGSFLAAAALAGLVARAASDIEGSPFWRCVAGTGAFGVTYLAFAWIFYRDTLDRLRREIMPRTQTPR